MNMKRALLVSLVLLLETLVMRLVARKPDDRPADARAAIEELDAAVPVL